MIENELQRVQSDLATIVIPEEAELLDADPSTEQDIVIGKVNEFERKLWWLRRMYAAIATNARKRVDTHSKIWMAQAAVNRLKMVDSMLWSSVYGRVTYKAPPSNTEGLSIRRNGEIVLLLKKEEITLQPHNSVLGQALASTLIQGIVEGMRQGIEEEEKEKEKEKGKRKEPINLQVVPKKPTLQ